jgi:hypothetical protein
MAKPAAAPKKKASAAKPKAASTGAAHPPYFEVSACRSLLFFFPSLSSIGFVLGSG